MATHENNNTGRMIHSRSKLAMKSACCDTRASFDPPHPAAHPEWQSELPSKQHYFCSALPEELGVAAPPPPPRRRFFREQKQQFGGLRSRKEGEDAEEGGGGKRSFFIPGDE